MRVLDLFSGIGGWTRGLHAAGYETVAACEINDWKRAQYQRLHPEVTVYCDVRELIGADIIRRHGPIDLIAGSPPCQNISSVNAGKQKGVDGDGLFFEATRLVNEIRPHWFAFENSPGLRTRGADRVFADIERAGYACWPIVVGACHAGAAHKRQRVWVLGRLAESEQGRSAGQSRRHERMGDNAAGERRERAGLCGSDRVSESVPAHMHGVEGRAGSQQDERNGQEARDRSAPYADISFRRIGPAGAEPLSSHLRAYDGVSSRDAERARHAYGAAIVPQIATAIGRAIMTVENSL